MAIRLYITSLLVLCFFSAYATHNRAGEITYTQVGPLTIQVKVTTYTKTSSVSADRDSIELFWGDGTSEFVQRTNGNGENLGNDVKLNEYITEHTYPGRATYTIGFKDPNRVASILNVNYPNSIDVEFYLSTTFTFLDPQFQGVNNSAILLQPPIDRACANTIFTHNPNAYDIDGDSLAFELGIPMMNATQEVPGYQFPNEIGPGPTNNISIDPITGTFTWNTPKIQGEYNIAIKIKEFRNGVLLNTITRDMQIFVTACDNAPPVIETEKEICVIAGETIDLEILISDPDDGDKVLLTATGGPFVVDTMPAQLIKPFEGYGSAPYSARFVWETNCNHISAQYYQVVLRAVDDYFPDSTGLATLFTLRIKVTGPSPENLTAESELSGIRLFWDQPYACEETDDDFFQGFSVWRKVGSSTYPLDTCDPGLTGSPYEKIIFLTNEVQGGRYTALDVDVEKGITYCYRVIAEFAKISSSGFPYNRIESLHSNEVCQQLIRDLPILTKVSITETDNENGEVHVRWSKPLADDLDTIMNPPPYKYEFYRSLDGGLNYDLLPAFTINTSTFSEEIDTNFIDTNINTLEIRPQYYIKFFSNNNEYGNSSSASSTFLDIAPTDEQLILTWDEEVPWSKVSYDIYLFNETTMVFDSLTNVINPEFTHINLENGQEYCYYIKSYGSYDIPNIEDPLINDSQIGCARPYDNVPPCEPVLEVSNICNTGGEIIDIEGLVNTLIFTQPNLDCPETDDAIGYYIYYSEEVNGDFILIDSILDPTQNRYFHNPERGISGCYAITAFDMNRNESDLSNEVCVDNCPAYELPNTFTPNGDGYNDLFIPTINRFIEGVEFIVYNEWGNKIFETNDPDLNWNGVNESGSEVSEGTYYYVCRVFEQRVSGTIEDGETLKGYINLLR